MTPEDPPKYDINTLAYTHPQQYRRPFFDRVGTGCISSIHTVSIPRYFFGPVLSIPCSL